MAIRVRKLAKQLGRSEADLLQIAAEIGLPQTRGSDQLSAAAEKKLKEAAKKRPQGGRLPKISPPGAAPVKAPAFSDPLADSWMDLAMADDAGAQEALRQKALDRQLNRRKTQHSKKADPPPTHTRHRDWDDDPSPLHAAKESRPAKVRAKDDKSPDDVLKALGFAGSSSRKDIVAHIPEAEAALLSHAHLKPADVKRIEAAVHAHIARCCGELACQKGLEGSGKVVMLVSDQTACDYCSGSNTKRSVADLLGALDNAGVKRLLIVGGSPNSHDEVRALLPKRIALKLIPGTSRATRKQARDHLAWAQVAAIWGSTQLDHKVSNHYRGRPTGSGRKTIHVDHRSLEFLAQAIAVHLSE